LECKPGNLQCTMKETKVTIKIPRELYEKLSMIVFVMRSLASGKVEEEDRLTAEEIRIVRERLKRLGYL